LGGYDFAGPTAVQPSTPRTLCKVKVKSTYAVGQRPPNSSSSTSEWAKDDRLLWGGAKSSCPGEYVFFVSGASAALCEPRVLYSSPQARATSSWNAEGEMEKGSSNRWVGPFRRSTNLSEVPASWFANAQTHANACEGTQRHSIFSAPWEFRPPHAVPANVDV